MKKLSLNGKSVDYPDGSSTFSIDPDDSPRVAPFSAGDLIAYNNSLVGKILTIIDAIGLQPDQKKATKDLIKHAMWHNYDIVRRWMNDQYAGKASCFPFSDLKTLE